MDDYFSSDAFERTIRAAFPIASPALKIDLDKFHIDDGEALRFQWTPLSLDDRGIVGDMCILHVDFPPLLADRPSFEPAFVAWINAWRAAVATIPPTAPPMKGDVLFDWLHRTCHE